VSELTLAGLRVVLEVARTGSFTAAAERLGYTQSAISRQVAVTEQTAGSPLFTRHARGVRPTAAGEVLVRHAAKVLDTVTSASQELAGMRDRLAGRLVVGGFPTATAALLPRAVARLLKDHPGLEIQLMEASTPTQLLALRRGRLEVAILATGEGLPEHDLDGLHLTALRSARGAGVAVAEAHPFAVRQEVNSEELADQAWVVGAKVADSLEFGAWPGIEKPQVAFATHDWPTRLGLVAAGLGIALVPGIAASAVPRGVRWIPIRDAHGGLGRQAWAVTTNNSSEAARAMVTALEAEVAQIVDIKVDVARPARLQAEGQILAEVQTPGTSRIGSIAAD
jgi:DNA-binding transcriptional LysR family regulator